MKNIVIFGDSYSTFSGYIPKGYAPYYPSLDVQTVEDTWWKKFVAKTGVNLVLNNSWSGSTICYPGWEKVDCSKTSSFIYRYRQLKEENFFTENKVDTVFVFGGTNDSWSDSPLGQMMLSDWTEKDLYNALPAICYLMAVMKADLPNLNIVFIVNAGLKSEIVSCMKQASEYYGVKTIFLQDAEKMEGHPTAKGMTEICENIIIELKGLLASW